MMMVEEDHEHKQHICKFCSKSFPCGRSLGGHMRSHLTTITSSDHYNSGLDLPKKRLPPLVGGKRSDFFSGKKPNRALKLGKGDALLGEKHCRECGKSFHSCKSLFGHMKSHPLNLRASTSVEEETLGISKQAHNSEFDNESCWRNGSDRVTSCIPNTNSSSFLSIANFSPSEIKKIEQEVALSLIILSKDKRDWSCLNSCIIESSDNSSESLQHKTVSSHNISPNMSEVNPRSSRKRRHNEARGSTSNAPTLLPDLETKTKFRCSVCKKGFPSYQALGGHRASHKKYKGYCNNTQAGENSPSVSELSKHECPLCLKVFPSGQALGGHKKSHISTNGQPKSSRPDKEIAVSGIRGFLDLNLPAPDEDEDEECIELKPWWMGSDDHGHQLLSC